MTVQSVYLIVALVALVLMAAALISYSASRSPQQRPKFGLIALSLGLLALVGFMGWLWVALERPPMRTIPETMLWTAVFLPVIGLVMEYRWRGRLSLISSIVLSMMLLMVVLLFKPLTADKSMMPALRSPWFAPHVLIYMIAYSTLGIAAIVSAWRWIESYFKKTMDLLPAVEEGQRLVYIAFPLMTAGMLLGAYWAKIAWGHYWGWDPKETWAFISWGVYLAYLHIDRYLKLTPRTNLALITVAFPALLCCWFIVNLLPTAEMSVHTYTGTN